MPVRLGIITSHLPYGSSEAFLYPEISELIALGYEVTVFPAAPRSRRRLHNDVAVEFVSFPLSSPRTWLRAWKGIRSNLSEACAAFATIVKTKYSFKAKLKNLALFPLALAYANEARTRGITHLHAYWLSAPATVGLIAARVAGLSWSYTAHSWDIFMEDNLIATKMRSADFGRVISSQGRDGLRARAPMESSSQLEVIHLGVKISDYSPSEKTERQAGAIKLLCPAYLLPVKGHSYLLQALRGVIDAGIDCQCVFAGEGRLRAPLAQKIHDLQLERVVSMPGMIRHDLFLEQLHSGLYDAVVLASVRLGMEFEGIPVSLMEAMAVGIPCIATRTGAIEELIDPTCGVLVGERDPSGLRDAIMSLALDPSRRKALGEQARRRIEEQFDAKHSARALASLISRTNAAR